MPISVLSRSGRGNRRRDPGPLAITRSAWLPAVNARQSTAIVAFVSRVSATTTSRNADDGIMGRVQQERGDLMRCWIEFDLVGQEPARPPHGVSLDGGTRAYLLLGRGVGVTGYDEADCLALVAAKLEGEPLPPVISLITDVDVDSLGLEHAGVPVWRGVWFPCLNLDPADRP